MSTSTKSPNQTILLTPSSDLIENGKIINPHNLPHPMIFLSGTTNYNKDESRWQEILTDCLLARARSTSTDNENVPDKANSFAPVTIIDPYNPTWDSTWREDPSDERFVTQVNFELEGLELADIVVVGFIGADVRAGKIGAGGTALVELGTALKRTGQKVVVCVEKGFWKEGWGGGGFLGVEDESDERVGVIGMEGVMVWGRWHASFGIWKLGGMAGRNGDLHSQLNYCGRPQDVGQKE
ncbi:uncharacterized protein EAF01_006466 [Botrytis porri]|uniref:Uncharacterized protein n=1 Tax=Botrytis porri TaxID=87229 RepID=A0A4Z1L4L0_9HELO|nr:uncharacterized protein EAF01_006466 [Botrytis porri]KAF7903417.1 hypothetical protein EAF01_006466 [Botrytis porri]TGO91751.1 hypothetical protein BPOR_0019g00110 [Botrytis porri]